MRGLKFFGDEMIFFQFDEVSNLRDIGLNKRMRFELLHPVQYPLQQNWPIVCPPSLTALSGIHVY